MLKLLHISDLHIGSRLKESQGVLARLSYIRQNYPDHELIVTGDITDNGDDHELDRAMHALMPFDVHLVPGNHDYGRVGNFYSPKRALRFMQYLLPGCSRWSFPIVDVNETERVVMIGCDTCKRTKHWLDFARGKLGGWQRWRLKRILRKYKDYFKIVYFHHHPFTRDFTMAMEDHKATMKVLEPADLVLFGHKHKKERWPLCGSWTLYRAAGRFDECDTVTEIIIEGGLLVCDRDVPVVL